MLKGYVFIEADGPHSVEKAITGVKHVRSRVPGVVAFQEVERYIVVKPVIEKLDENDLVEVVGGPFKGMRAKITRVDKAKEDVTLELLEATFTSTNHSSCRLRKTCRESQKGRMKKWEKKR